MRIALINEKGGTGKTTLAVHLAAHIAERLGKRTLLVDMDPQGQVGKTLGFPARVEGGTTRDLFLDKQAKPQELARPTHIDNLDLIPADKSLTDVVPELIRKQDGHRTLEQRFKGYRSHPVVIFDSPPSLGFLTQNILYASDRVVLPVALTYLALDGCAEIIQTVQAVQEDKGGTGKNKVPQVAAIVPTFRRPTRMAQEITERLETYFPDWLCQSIGFYVAVDEAQSHGKPVWDYRRSSKAAKVFRDVCIEISGKLGLK